MRCIPEQGGSGRVPGLFPFRRRCIRAGMLLRASLMQGLRRMPATSNVLISLPGDVSRSIIAPCEIPVFPAWLLFLRSGGYRHRGAGPADDSLHVARAVGVLEKLAALA